MIQTKLLIFLLFFAVLASSKRIKKVKPFVVLVTGSSSGIGKSTALEFAADPKFKVFATMRSPHKWTEAAKDNLVVEQMDVTSQESVDRAVAKIIEQEGKIDIVVNNAGFGLAGCLETAHVFEAKELFDVNVWGVVRVMHSVLPHMRKQKSGHMIQISSTSGIRGIPCMEYYTGSKFALEGITDSMRYTMSSYNISLTNVNAGPVRTQFTDRFGHSEVGGKGTREVPNDETGYLQAMTNKIIASLNARIQGGEGQESGEVATVVVNIANMKLKHKRVTDIPFNIGTSFDSQKLIEEVRRQPTGWGGVYHDILRAMPPLVAPPPPNAKRNHEEL